MKKIMIIALVFMVSIVTLGAAQVGTDKYLTVYGSIGATSLSFSTSQTLTEANRIDLINNTAVQPAGAGVEVGTWSLLGQNQAAAVNYSVTYTYAGLKKATDDPNPIAYELIVAEDESAVKTTGQKTLFTAPAGTVNVLKTIKVRLTAAGVATAASAASSSDYSSSITLVLATE